MCCLTLYVTMGESPDVSSWTSLYFSLKTSAAADCLIEPKLKQHYKIPRIAIDARTHEPMRYTRRLQYLQDAARPPFGSFFWMTESARSCSCCEWLVASPYLIVDRSLIQLRIPAAEIHRRGRQVFHKVTHATVSLFTYNYLYFTLQKIRNISLV